MRNLIRGYRIRRLTDNEKRLLVVALPDSRLSVADLARKAKMRHHTAAYALSTLKADKIVRPYALMNPHLLGLTDFCVFFNYSGEEKNARQKIIEYCCNSSEIAYFAELTGAFQYSVSLFCQSPIEVSRFFSELGKLLPRSAFERSFAMRLDWTQFLGREFSKKPYVLRRIAGEERSEIDDTDRKVLSTYSRNADKPLIQTAKECGMSESAIRYRLAALEKKGLLIAVPYYFDAKRLGITTFRMLLTAKGLHPALQNELYTFMLNHRYASAFVHCVGTWDFELSFDVSDVSLIGEITGEVYDTFGSSINLSQSVQEIAVYRAHHFPAPAAAVR